jgi:hypothetical protein
MPLLFWVPFHWAWVYGAKAMAVVVLATLPEPVVELVQILLCPDLDERE